MWLQKLWYKTLSLVFGFAAFGFGFAMVAVIYSQVTLWLKTAVWIPHTIGEQLIELEIGYPILQNWLGAQKIVDDVLSWPASLGYFLVGLGLAFAAGWTHIRFEEIQNTELADLRRKEMVE
jgi:hypothetical protein